MDKSVKILVENIRNAISEMKKSGTVGCSVRCLKQNTRTNGLTCSRSEYESAFLKAVDEVRKSNLKFDLYD